MQCSVEAVWKRADPLLIPSENSGRFCDLKVWGSFLFHSTFCVRSAECLCGSMVSTRQVTTGATIWQTCFETLGLQHFVKHKAFQRSGKDFNSVAQFGLQSVKVGMALYGQILV